jgi:hypothetical protein
MTPWLICDMKCAENVALKLVVTRPTPCTLRRRLICVHAVNALWEIAYKTVEMK